MNVVLGSLESVDEAFPLAPYDPLVCEFLSTLSRNLLSSMYARKYSDVVSFAYWIRSANISKMKRSLVGDGVRSGIGKVLHITPANIPVNFAFSFVFSLLAGNANIVRLPTKHFEQVSIIISAISDVLLDQKYSRLKELCCFVRYEQNIDKTKALSLNCAGRIIWGGDEAINAIRKIPIPPRCLEITFANRYSICLLNASVIINISVDALNNLAKNFYNDAYLFDQNACSSPRLILWIGSDEDVMRAKNIFWTAVADLVARLYEAETVHIIDKFNYICNAAIAYDEIEGIQSVGNYIQRLQISRPFMSMESISHGYGLFLECDVRSLNLLAKYITTKYQTITYFGFLVDDLRSFVIDNHLKGVDRIVPVGRALEIDINWDGYDLVRSLSRKIEIH